jgi:epoxyqueuosine reductase
VSPWPALMLTSQAIKEQAQAIGFDLCGIARADDYPELKFLSEWLARGYAGEMKYLERSAHTRADIRRLLPSARSVIVTGAIYNTDQGSQSGHRGSGPRDAITVARYARGQDYHKVIEDRLLALIDWMRARHDTPFEAVHFVDKHHVQERVYAHHAGIGWIGKNACVINPGLGSWMFLSGIAVSLALPPDAPGVDQCGSCTLCIDACPTGAIVEAREIDATRCISYLTIETEAQIPEHQRPWLGRHAWGCDICQEVCPWNLGSPVSGDPAWQGPARDGLSAAELWQKSDDELHDLIKGSAMTFVPLSRLRRNLAVIIGNSGDRTLAGALDRPGDGKKNAARSALTPAVQDAVAWARQQLDAG